MENKNPIERIKKSESARLFDINDALFFTIKAKTLTPNLTPRSNTNSTKTTSSSTGPSPTRPSSVEDASSGLGRK